MPDTTTAAAPPADAKADAIRHLWQLDATRGDRLPYLYALLDAARDAAIYPKLRALAAGEDIVSLYQGPTATELAAVAPYLICLGTGPRVFDWLWEAGWGRSWGVYFWSVTGLAGLRAHFRTLTRVRTEAGQMLLFRFYDPRVLRVFLPTCSPAQLDEMFGPVTTYFAESGDGAAIETFEQHSGVLRQRTLPLG